MLRKEGRGWRESHEITRERRDEKGVPGPQSDRPASVVTRVALLQSPEFFSRCISEEDSNKGEIGEGRKKIPTAATKLMFSERSSWQRLQG